MYAIVICLLIQQLGNEDFDLRETAEIKLIAEGWKTAPLIRGAMKHDDPEIKRRATIVYQAIKNQVLDSMEPFPMIDAYWLNWATGCYQGCRPEFAEYINQGLDEVKPGKNWWHYRRATRLLTSDRLDQDWSIDRIEGELFQLHIGDAIWLRRLSFKYSKNMIVRPWQLYFLRSSHEDD